MKELKLGIIGLSEGNGHPYSWAAIFNGYNKEEMSQCPFPVIPVYLAEQNYPEAAIKNAKVTHIWTQSKDISKHVAKAANIPIVCDTMEEMIPDVDAILLARDDAEHHLAMAEPFLKARLPVYIDKPMAYSVSEAKKIYALEQYQGQIFTCSALLYSKELQLSRAQKNELGDIVLIEAQIMKSWKKYAIHIIDPVLNLINTKVQTSRTSKTKTTTNVEVICENGIKLSFTTHKMGQVPIEIKVFGTKGSVVLKFSDTFNAFKAALQHFINIVQDVEKVQDKSRVLERIAIVEMGV